jgi:hypothetical protein
MAFVESMALTFHGANQGFKGEACILDRLHMVMFMSINLDETIDDFKARGREMLMESFDNLQLGVDWSRYFWAYYCQFGMKRVPLPSMACFKNFLK